MSTIRRLRDRGVLCPRGIRHASGLRREARAEVRVTIEKVLDAGLLSVYTPEFLRQKTTAVFQHVYEAHYGAGNSVYDRSK